MPAGSLALVRSHRSLCNCISTRNQKYTFKTPITREMQASLLAAPTPTGDVSSRKKEGRMVVQGIASGHESTLVPSSNHRISRKPSSNETNTDQLLLINRSTVPETFHVRVCQTGSSDRLVHECTNSSEPNLAWHLI